jgi:dienelactone hydrolase
MCSGIRRVIVPILTIGLLWGACHAAAQDRGETVWIPMQDKGFFGTKDIKLEATLYKPAGDGPFPLVIFNHGSTGPGMIPPTRTENPWGYGTYLVKKGIALLIPMRRGRGRSEGTYQEPYECSLHQARSGVRYASRSLEAVYGYLDRQPWVDRSKVILSGTSRGGILSVVYAAEHPASAIGVINFVGGWMTDRCKAQAGVDINSELFLEAGAKSRIPNLFLYATNDSFYSVSSLETYPVAFRQNGGDASFKLYTIPDANGHGLFYSHYDRWIPDVDGFLVTLGVWKP